MTGNLDIKQDFETFSKNPDLVYLDSASTTFVPRPAVAATTDFLNSIVVSSRRGAHSLAVKGGAIVEDVRESLAKFLNTEKSLISFQKSVPSTVASLVYGFDWKTTNKNKIVIAQSEENSVLVSILRAAEVLGLTVETIPIDTNGAISLDVLESALDNETGIVAVGHVTPGFGHQNPIDRVSKIVHNEDALLLTDATRSVGFDNSITSLGSDVLIFSANASFMGPPGLTIQWINKSLGEKFLPGILGGSAVSDVKASSYVPAFQPDKFEPGYLNVPAVAGLGASLEYITNLYSNGFHAHLKSLSKHMYKRLKEVPQIVIYGRPSEKTTIFGFNLSPEAVNCHDVALFLDESNVAVRSGLICAHPSVQTIAEEGIIQASLHAYNSISDIDHLIDTLTVISSQLL